MEHENGLAKRYQKITNFISITISILSVRKVAYILYQRHTITHQINTWTEMKLALYLGILSAVTALSDKNILQKLESLENQLEQVTKEKQKQIQSLEKKVDHLTEKQQLLETGQLEICKCRFSPIRDSLGC